MPNRRTMRLPIKIWLPDCTDAKPRNSSPVAGMLARTNTANANAAGREA